MIGKMRKTPKQVSVLLENLADHAMIDDLGESKSSGSLARGKRIAESIPGPLEERIVSHSAR